MNAVRQRVVGTLSLAWALVGVPATFYLYVDWTYRYALAQGKLPFSLFPAWLWYVVFGLLVVTGVIGLTKLSQMRTKVRLVIGVLYVTLMAGVLLVVHIGAACANGDCI